MLYERWRRISETSPQQIALTDLTAGRSWTFRQLAEAAESGRGGSDAVAYPTGQTASFVITVLRAWRFGQIVCPLEGQQEVPDIREPLTAGVAHLKTTSASSAEPRLVAFTAAQLMADAQNIVQTMQLRPEWPNVGLISLAHSYGFSNLVTPLLLHGIPLVAGEAPLPEVLRMAAADQEAITVAAVPALWRTWLEAGTIPRNLRLAISAGALLPIEVEQAIFERCGVKVHNFYGSSECGGIAYDISAEPRSDPAYVGAPMENVQVSVGQNGCLEVRGEAVGQGYWPEPDASLSGGVFRTTDLGEVRDGMVYLRGRATDQINIAGRKVSPEAIERVFSRHPQVRACVAFGVPGADTQRGETIVLCVQGQGAVNGETLKQFALQHLPAWQVPRDWWFVDQMQPNARGKLSRATWRKRYLDEAAEMKRLKR